MVRRYKSEIDDTMFSILTKVDKIQYNQLFKEIKKRLGHLSYETFNKRLRSMLEDGLIEREEVLSSNMTINPTFYSLSKR